MERPRLIGKVFASIRPGQITIDFGYRYGMISGPGLVHVQQTLVPPGSRMPNSRVWVGFGEGNSILSITPLTKEENREEDLRERRFKGN